MLGPVFRRYHDGTRFGRLACQLVEKDGFEGFKARVFFCAQKAIAWTEPLTWPSRSSVRPLRLGWWPMTCRTPVSAASTSLLTFCCKDSIWIAVERATEMS
jgi:hypothetical protein